MKKFIKKFNKIGSWQWKLKCKVWNIYIYYVNKLIQFFNKEKFVCHDSGHIKTFDDKTLHMNDKSHIYICHDCAVATQQAAHKVMRKAIFGKLFSNY